MCKDGTLSSTPLTECSLFKVKKLIIVMILGSIFIIEYTNENKALKFEVIETPLICCFVVVVPL